MCGECVVKPEMNNRMRSFIIGGGVSAETCAGTVHTVLQPHNKVKCLPSCVWLMGGALLLATVLGCATPPHGFDRIGGYNQGQFSENRNEGFIKLNTPQSEDHNPLLDDPWAILKCPSGRYIKLCEWHCVDEFNY